MARLPHELLFFFFNDTATTEIYTLSLHDALPISRDHLADPRRVLPRLGERLQWHRDLGPERRQQPLGDRPPAGVAADAHDPVRVHLLLPVARGRRVRRHHGDRARVAAEDAARRHPPPGEW